MIAPPREYRYFIITMLGVGWQEKYADLSGTLRSGSRMAIDRRANPAVAPLISWVVALP